MAKLTKVFPIDNERFWFLQLSDTELTALRDYLDDVDTGSLLQILFALKLEK